METDLPITPQEFQHLVDPYDASKDSGSVHVSTVIPQDVNRLIEIVLNQDLGYTSKSDFIRDCVIKWLMIMTEAIKKPEYEEYLSLITRIRTQHSSQVQKTRQIKGEDFVLAAEEEVRVLVDAGELDEAALAVMRHLESIYSIGGITSRIWLKSYLKNPSLKSHLEKIINSNTASSKILKGIILDLDSTP